MSLPVDFVTQTDFENARDNEKSQRGYVDYIERNITDLLDNFNAEEDFVDTDNESDHEELPSKKLVSRKIQSSEKQSLNENLQDVQLVTL